MIAGAIPAHDKQTIDEYTERNKSPDVFYFRLFF
nr:MAG TPA: hypothetical protein [Caudoviricetes sp.]